MLNTVVQQIAYHCFETLLCGERRKGELSPSASPSCGARTGRGIGPAFDLTPDYGIYWACTPFFVKSPFYVYAYAFGECLVNALYGVFRQGLVPGFERKYHRDAPRRRHHAAPRAAGAVRA